MSVTFYNCLALTPSQESILPWQIERGSPSLLTKNRLNRQSWWVSSKLRNSFKNSTRSLLLPSMERIKVITKWYNLKISKLNITIHKIYSHLRSPPLISDREVYWKLRFQVCLLIQSSISVKNRKTARFLLLRSRKEQCSKASSTFRRVTTCSKSLKGKYTTKRIWKCSIRSTAASWLKKKSKNKTACTLVWRYGSLLSQIKEILRKNQRAVFSKGTTQKNSENKWEMVWGLILLNFGRKNSKREMRKEQSEDRIFFGLHPWPNDIRFYVLLLLKNSYCDNHLILSQKARPFLYVFI